MKSAPTTLINFLNQVRGTVDGQLIQTDAFLFALRSGASYGYTTADVSFTYNSQLYLGNNVLIDGLQYKASIGLEVEQQQISIAARPEHMVGGVPFLQALREGVFDGAEITRSRVFYSDAIGGTLIG